MITVEHIKHSSRPFTKVLGTSQAVILSGEQTNGCFTLIEQVESRGSRIPMHVHEHEDETFFITEGTVELVVGPMKLALRKGDTAFCPKGVPHAWEVTNDAGACFLVLITPAGLERMFNELAGLTNIPPSISEVERVCTEYGIRFTRQ